MTEGRKAPPNEPSLLMKGMAARSSMTDVPLGAYRVFVTRCNGRGECADVCVVDVFTKNGRGECTVVNEVLCFGCLACVAQCSEGGVRVIPSEKGYVTAEEALR